jgi:protein YIPF1/2
LPFKERLKSYFTIQFWQDYFDVTTEIVVRRIVSAFNPFVGSFFQIHNGKADFYGPFWILTTLILEMGTLSNL